MAEDVASRVYDRTLAQVRQASTGRERSRLVGLAAERLQVSRQTVYRQLRSRGWDSGRSQRSDAGQGCLDDRDLEVVASLVARGRNKRGRPNVPVKQAHAMAAEAGLIPEDVSYAHLCRRLRERGLDRRRMCAQPAGIFRVSTHPNQAWFFDISVAIQWYFRDESGQKLEMYGDAGARFYEGKLENYRRVRRVIRRYMAVDHYSGAFYVRYYYNSGETAEDVVDFFWHAMSEKAVGRDRWPFMGIPQILVMDQGSANKSALVTNLLRDLGVEIQLHATGNAKASGSVETRHRHWQESFEGRLSQRPARDLLELNRWAEAFANTQTRDVVHTRHGMPPLSLWMTITPDQLLEPPERDTFFQLAATNPQTGTLTNRCVLRADGRKWHIKGEHVYTRQKVQYRLAPFFEQGIRVWDEHGRELAAEELFENEAGFPINGPRHVFGEEGGAAQAAPPAQRIVQRQDAGRDEDDVRITDVFDNIEAQVARHRYLAPRGRTWSPPTPQAEQAAAEPLLSSGEARERVAQELGRALGSDGAWFRAQIGDGITESALLDLIDEFQSRGQSAASPLTEATLA